MAGVPRSRNRMEPRGLDCTMCGRRHRIENFFERIKEFRAKATRRDKTGGSFAAATYLVVGKISVT